MKPTDHDPASTSKRPIRWLMSLALALPAVAGLAAVGLSPTHALEPAATITQAKPAAQVPPLGSTQRASGLTWSSGVSPELSEATKAQAFATDRGTALDNISVYPGRKTWEDLLSTYWYAALPSTFKASRDDLVVAVPIWPKSGSVSDTGTRDQWTALGKEIATADPYAYVRLGWEMNIPAQNWALTAANRTQWLADFRREVRLLRVDCPKCQFVWNPNHSEDVTDTSSRSAFKSLRDLISVYAVDDYDIYPPILDARSRRAHMGAYGRLAESYAFARRWHVQFAVPEWGISCNGPRCQWAGHAGGDNPMYINTYVRWFAAHAKHLAFETYFDNPVLKVRSSLYTHPIGHKAGAAYRHDLRQLSTKPLPK